MNPYSGKNIALNILIVEDERNLALLQKDCLEEAGHRAIITENGEKALELLDKEQINVVLLDQMLPAMAGAEVFARILHEGHDVCIIMITGRRDCCLAEQIVAYGAEDYIVKDNDLRYVEALPRIVERCWKQHEIKKENKRLKNENNLLRRCLTALLNSSSDYIFVMDKYNHITLASEGFMELTGLKNSDILGNTCFSVVHQKNKCIHDCPYQDTLKTGQTVTKTIHTPLFKHNVLATTIPIFNDENKIEQVIHIFKPIKLENEKTYDIRRKNLEVWQRYQH
ncbi:MAG TPA: response regulator [Thermodesulfovibrionia bacterium]|nr:response regulator [Thermodesulfovibrionia bacterium]